MSMRSALQQSASPLDQDSGTTGGWQRRHFLPATSLAFAGHFPDRPVLPAVVQCLMAQMAVEEGLGRPLRLAAICQAKFTAPLEPECEILLRVRPGRLADHWDCTLHAGEVAAASLRLHLVEEDKA